MAPIVYHLVEVVTRRVDTRGRILRRVGVGLAVPAIAVAVLHAAPDQPERAFGGTDTETSASVGPVSTVTTAPPPTTAPPAPPPDQATLDAVALQLVAVAAADQPVALVPRPGSGVLYVAERQGTVSPLVDGQLGAPVLDITDDTTHELESGLLSIAFSPDGTQLYLKHNDAAGTLQVAEYTMAGDVVDPATRRVLLTVEKDEQIHNGGNLWVDAAGLLWVTFGDNGPIKNPPDAAQRLDTWLGKVLRIDPHPQGDRPYGIPEGNPFVATEGALPEIWAYGLRNPWRWAIDTATGDVWIGDVGRYTTEEITVLPGGGPGANLGWPLVEGTGRRLGDPPADHVVPVYQYSHEGERCSVTGGFVYRGTQIAGLAGAYVFGDYCEGKVRAISVAGGAVIAERIFDPFVQQLASFAQDASGELWVLSIDGTIARLAPL